MSEQVWSNDGEITTDSEWDNDPDSRHDEMLRQDRNRLVLAGSAGIVVATLTIIAALFWVNTMRAPVSDNASSAVSSVAPATLYPSGTSQDIKAHNSEAQDIEAKLRALAPHEVLAVSQGIQSEAPKKVKTERIGTKVD